MDDDLVCEYDSTWDTESDGDELENTGRSKKTRPAFVCCSLYLSLSHTHTYTHSSSVNHCTVPLFYSILSIAPIGFIGGVYICVLTHPRRNLHAHLFLWNEL